MTEGIKGSSVSVGQLPPVSTPLVTEQNANARVDAKKQDDSNDFAAHLNEQAVTLEKKVVQSQTFDPAAEISRTSVYSPSNGSNPV